MKKATFTIIGLLVLCVVANAGSINVMRHSSNRGNWAPSQTDQFTPAPDSIIVLPNEVPAAVAADSYNTMVDIHWGAVPDAIGYNVYQAGNPGGPYETPLNAEPVQMTLFRHSNLTNGADYYYVVRAVFADHVSTDSEEVDGHPTSGVALSPVTDVTITRDGSNLVLEWTPVSNDPSITGYRVSRLNAQMVEDRSFSITKNFYFMMGDADPLDVDSHIYNVEAVSSN